MTDEEDGKSRRNLLRTAGAFVGGAALGGAVVRGGADADGQVSGERRASELTAGGDRTTSSEYDTAEGNLTVRSQGSDPVDEYRNQQGEVETEGLQTAINDFINRDISTGVLQDVINAFLSS